MGKKVKILIIENSKDFTGAFKSIMMFSKALENEFEFVWCIPKNSLIKTQLEKSGIQYHEIPFQEISRSIMVLLYPFILLRNSIKISQIAKKEDISIIHVNDIYNMCGAVLKLFQPKLLLIYHVRLLPTSYIGPFFYFFKIIIQIAADKIVTVSSAIDAFFKKETVLISDWYAVSKEEENKEKENDTFNILYVGAIMPGKGQLEALKVMKLMVPKYTDMKLTFIGRHDSSDPFFHKLSSFIQNNHLSDVVSFQPHTLAIGQTYRNSDVVLNLSFSESFSMICVEAGAYGRPVISTKSGGPGDIIIDGETGFLVKIGDYSSMLKHLIALKENKALRRKIGMNAKAHVEKKFSGKDQVMLLKSLYLKQNDLAGRN